jgi:TonB-linked SusC/RagA family outer membrane protein
VAQQSSKLKGIVSDSFGPVAGASVIIKGTTNGIMTDADGAYSLDGIKKGDVIVFSYIGYIPQEIVYNGQSTLDVQLKEDNKQLDEVVVVGYGTQKKVNLTGSVSMVNSEVLESRPVQNVSQALQGVVPGLSFSVNNSGGTLDNQMEFNIRGTGTIGEGSGSSPLVLIDGIEGNMNTINANDIESISVLKDAAASSIYGAKAAFGVILIKTKSGKSGKTNVSYTGNVRFSDAIQLPDMMDSYQFALYFNRAAANNGQGAVFSDEVLQRIQDYQAGKINTVSTPSSDGRWNSYTGSNANTNWFDEMYQDWAPSQEHNLSISGGSEKITYRVSGSYLNQRGLINFGEDRFKRYTTDAKITAVLADWVTMNYNSKWTREDYTRPTYMTGLFFHNIARRWPTCFVYDDNGYLADGMEIIQMQNGGKRNQQNNYYTQQLSFLFEPIKDWKINVEGNMRTYNNNQHWAVLPVYAHDANGEAYGISWDGGADYAVGQTRVYDYRYKEDFFTTNIYTSYTKSIGKNNFTGMIGFNGELTKYDYITGQGDGLYLKLHLT